MGCASKRDRNGRIISARGAVVYLMGSIATGGPGPFLLPTKHCFLCPLCFTGAPPRAGSAYRTPPAVRAVPVHCTASETPLVTSSAHASPAASPMPSTAARPPSETWVTAAPKTCATATRPARELVCCGCSLGGASAQCSGSLHCPRVMRVVPTHACHPSVQQPSLALHCPARPGFLDAPAQAPVASAPPTLPQVLGSKQPLQVTGQLLHQWRLTVLREEHCSRLGWRLQDGELLKLQGMLCAWGWAGQLWPQWGWWMSNRVLHLLRLLRHVQCVTSTKHGCTAAGDCCQAGDKCQRDAAADAAGTCAACVNTTKQGCGAAADCCTSGDKCEKGAAADALGSCSTVRLGGWGFGVCGIQGGCLFLTAGLT